MVSPAGVDAAEFMDARKPPTAHGLERKLLNICELAVCPEIHSPFIPKQPSTTAAGSRRGGARNCGALGQRAPRSETAS